MMRAIVLSSLSGESVLVICVDRLSSLTYRILSSFLVPSVCLLCTTVHVIAVAQTGLLSNT